jgi:hypothetical protein
MKKVIFLICTALYLLPSCVKEREKARLLEYEIKGQLYTYEGFAFRYNDYVNNVSQGYDWHIYNLGQSALYIQAYDKTFTKTLFNYPDYQAEFTVELPEGNSKIYRSSKGQFRMTGQEMGDVVGDFHFTMKNVLDPLDSIMIVNGYFRIYLERRDRVFSK